MNANAIVALTATSTATANRAHWYFGDFTMTIVRRRLANGMVRVRMVAESLEIASAQRAARRVEFRDLPSSEGNAEFTVQVLKWESFHRAQNA